MILLAVSGCSVLPFQYTAQIDGPRTRASGSFEQFVAKAPPGSSLKIAGDSPVWPGATVYVRESYHAASGRICRNLTVVQSGLRHAALVCRQPDGDWERVRALAQYRRAVIPPSAEQSDPAEAP